MDASVPLFQQRLEPLGLDVAPAGECGFEKLAAAYRVRLELLEEALRVYQGRAFYDGTGDLDREDLDRLTGLYGLIVL